MGVLSDAQNNNDGGNCAVGGLMAFVRRKQVDSDRNKSSSSSAAASASGASSPHRLAKALTIPHLIAIGMLQFLFAFGFRFANFMGCCFM